MTDLKALCEETLRLDAAATPGPWSTRTSSGLRPRNSLPVVTHSAGTATVAECWREADIQVIAHYRTAAPALARALLSALERQAKPPSAPAEDVVGYVDLTDKDAPAEAGVTHAEAGEREIACGDGCCGGCHADRAHAELERRARELVAVLPWKRGEHAIADALAELLSGDAP